MAPSELESWRMRETIAWDEGALGRGETGTADGVSAARLSSSSLHSSSESESARALVEEASADCRVENLESAAERNEGGGRESSGGGRTELPGGGSGQRVRLRGREAADESSPGETSPPEGIEPSTDASAPAAGVAVERGWF